MDATTALRERNAGIRRVSVRAALPGPGRAWEFRRLVRMLSEHEAAEEAHVHPAVGNKAAMPVLGPVDRIRDIAARRRDPRRGS